jgi:transposase
MCWTAPTPGNELSVIVADESHEGAVHMQITTIGLDIAKNVLQVHGIDATEKVVVRKQLRRGQVMKFFEALPPCLIGMEAYASAHYWARELTKLGHEVRLMPAKDVKAYVKGNKASSRTSRRRGRASEAQTPRRTQRVINERLCSASSAQFKGY